jgi:predicted  nucleic acid-binding Zn-ribbon protein
VNTEKSLRKKAMDKVSELGPSLSKISSEDPVNELPATKDLRALRDEKLTSLEEERPFYPLPTASSNSKTTDATLLSGLLEEVQIEVEGLDTEIEEIKHEISKYRGLVDSDDDARNRMMEKLNKELEEAKQQEKEYESMVSQPIIHVENLTLLCRFKTQIKRLKRSN